jgi:TonB family protein
MRGVLCTAILLFPVAGSAQDSRISPPAPIVAFDKEGRAHGDATPPVAKYDPEPEYTESALRAGIEGEVWVALTVGADGVPYDLKVVRPLPFGLTDKAVETVKSWRFEPGKIKGRPVAMRIEVEVDFRVFRSTIGQVNLVNSAMGVNPGPYVDAAMARIYEQWMKLEPDELRSPFAKKGEAWIQFTIRKDGQAGNSQITAPSSDPSLDKVVLECITAANPFPPLPPELRGSDITLRMQFLYQSGMEILPSEATLNPGKTQQFSVNVGSTTNPPVQWTIEGPECTGSVCGMISTDGLYTAPADAPTARKATVAATLLSRHSVAAQAHVLIRKE